MLIALPMFGDYYTPDLMSGSPKTAMLGNAINGYVQGGPDKALGAALTLVLAAFLFLFMLYYLRVLRKEPMTRARSQPAELAARPAPRPRALRPRGWRSSPGPTWSGRCCRCCWPSASRSTPGARARRCRGCRCAGSGRTRRCSVRHDPTLWTALQHSLVLAGLAMLIATPLGTALALGLQRWRGPRVGRGQRADAAAARHAGARVRGRHVPAVHVGVLVHRAGDAGAGDRPRDVRAVLGRADRARAAGDDRLRRRGGGGRPGRAAVGGAARGCCCRC